MTKLALSCTLSLQLADAFFSFLLQDHTYIPGLITSHFEYLVTTIKPPMHDAPEQRFEVRRRFSDFVVRWHIH